jgi:hypothetical protein
LRAGAECTLRMRLDWSDESAAIEAGAINATGFRYVGALALEGEHFHER